MVFLLAIVAGSAVVALLGRRHAYPTRVVLVTLDTLRLDAFDTGMPLTRRWAERGLVFERFYAASGSTQPTHATIFTGLHPWEHGVHRNGLRLAPRVRTVAEILQALGFTTAAVVASFPLSSEFGFERGFDQYRQPFSQGKVAGEWEPFAEDPEVEPFYALAEDVVDEAVELLAGPEGTKQFFWFHFFDPHAPYGDRGPHDRSGPGTLRAAVRRGADIDAHIRAAREAYDEDVSTLDRQLDRLLEALLEDEGYQTHVVVTADHGECFGEGDSFGHGKRLLPAVIHVPTFVLSPRTRRARRVDVAGSIDIGTTLLRLAGIDDSLPGGRDLLEMSEELTEAVGMRRTFASPYEELRADGNTYSITGPLFFRIAGAGPLVVGNGNGLVDDEAEQSRGGMLALEGTSPADLRRGDDVETGGDASDTIARFRVFEEALSGTMLPDVMDPAAVRKLRALGYVQ